LRDVVGADEADRPQPRVEPAELEPPDRVQVGAGAGQRGAVLVERAGAEGDAASQPAVDRRRAAEAHHERSGRRSRTARSALAEPGARGPQRGALVFTRQEAQADRDRERRDEMARSVGQPADRDDRAAGRAINARTGPSVVPPAPR
jgi:hypothetical protein